MYTGPRTSPDARARIAVLRATLRMIVTCALLGGCGSPMNADVTAHDATTEPADGSDSPVIDRVTPDGMVVDADQQDADVVTADAPPDGPAAGEFGARCTRNGDCDSGLCLASGVCTRSCTGGGDCPTSWTCGALPGVGMLCQCTPRSSAESCDGMDDNCNGIVDDGATCPAPYVCSMGTCTCPAANMCASGCVRDFGTDPRNCGSCDHACATGGSCTGGTCVCPGVMGRACGGACTDLASDNANCGACGTGCDVGMSCVGGTCECPISGQMFCFGQCRDTRSDTNNCGSCGNVCPTGAACAGGTCSCPGTTPLVCFGVCQDGATDRFNCGACGTVCATGATCSSGHCTCPGAMGAACSGVCRDLAADTSNCGSCGNVCATGASCTDGACVCPGAMGRACSGTCRDLANDVSNCGGCGVACPAGATCSAGTCVCPGSMGRVCGSVCRDVAIDPSNCGACGNACTAGRVCSGGTCLPPPPRQVSPLSTSVVTSRRPTLRWVAASGSDGTHVEICADRACTMILASADVTGSTFAPSADLPTGVAFWRIRGTAAGAMYSGFGPTWQFTVGAVTAPIDRSWGTVLDVNGDRFADVLVASPQARSFAGRVRLYLGSATGLSSSPATTLDGPDGGLFGWSTASAGDVNGDGFADVIVGANNAAGITGRAYIYLGSAAGLSATPATTLTGPDGAMGFFGGSVSSAGDVNADGYADVVIGAQGVGSNAGRAYVYFGSASGLSTSPAVTLIGPDGAGGVFGYACAGSGDVNGDGFADIVVGAQGAASGTGRAYLFLGAAGGPSTTPSLALTGPDTFGAFGSAVAIAGDINGDGLADIAIGAPSASGAGRVYVFHGSTSAISTTPSTTVVAPDGSGSSFGWSLSAADVSGDGYSELVIGAPGVLSARGRVYVFLGFAGGLLASGAWTALPSPDAMGRFGSAVSLVGDVDGNAHPDIAVGAYGANSEAGNAYVYPCGSGGPTSPVILTGPDGAGARFGYTVASADVSRCSALFTVSL